MLGGCKVIVLDDRYICVDSSLFVVVVVVVVACVFSLSFDLRGEAG